MLEKLLASLGLIVCVALLVRMTLGQRLGRRVDTVARRWWHGTQHAFRRGWYVATHWRQARSAQRNAATAAEEAIRRARRGSQDASFDRDGNVYKPKSFRGPKKPH